MLYMKHKILLFCVIVCWSSVGFSASSPNLPTLNMPSIDVSDQQSLQRGAKVFMNYCMGCHSAAYMRYNRMADDLGIEDAVLESNLMFGTDKSGDTMTIAMQKKDAIAFFGTEAPDLSVISRSRGADWLFAYFMTFYRDENRPFGVNNLAFKDVAMPHVLSELQGVQIPVYKTVTLQDQSSKQVIDRLKLETPGSLSAQEYKQTIGDLVNFLVYIGEPAQIKRKNVGVFVILYLLVLLMVCFMLKKEYWKDVH